MRQKEYFPCFVDPNKICVQSCPAFSFNRSKLEAISQLTGSDIPEVSKTVKALFDTLSEFEKARVKRDRNKALQDNKTPCLNPPGLKFQSR